MRKLKRTDTGRHQSNRSTTLQKALERYQYERGISDEEMADHLAEIYCERVPEAYRDTRLTPYNRYSDPDEEAKRKESNRSLYRRILDGSVRISVNLEESLVELLPEDLRSELIADLGRRYGVLSIPIDYAAIHDLDQVSAVLKEVSEFVHAMTPILADNKIDGGDADHLRTAIKEGEEAVAAHLGLIKTMKHVLDSTEVIPNEP